MARDPARTDASASRTAAFSAAALILYAPAMLLPVIAVERLGHRHSSTIWSGVVELMSEGQVAIALIVLVCSVLIPLFKIGTMLVLCTKPLADRLLRRRHRALAFRALELVGRWGMLDVLLVAVLVAAVKLGDLFAIQPGPGAVAFAGVVLCSLLASATFDPLAIWHEDLP